MADLDIAAMDAAQKLEFARAVGSVVLDDQTINTPTPFILYSLPIGYSKFVLHMSDVATAASTTIIAAFSEDGESYPENESDYSIGNLNLGPDNEGGYKASGDAYDDEYAYIVDSGADTCNATVEIHPGSASSPARTHSHGRLTGADPASFVEIYNSRLNIGTIRQAFIKIGPYDFEGNLTAGRLVLVGVP